MRPRRVPGAMVDHCEALADTTELTETVFFFYLTGNQNVNLWIIKQQAANYHFLGQNKYISLSI